MAIAFLQQQAFILAPDFNTQVNAVVRTQAQTWWQEIPANDPQRDILRQQYAQVSDQPQAYGFVSTIVADADWSSGYDVWAGNPDSLRPVIETLVEKWFYLRTGITPPIVTHSLRSAEPE